MDPRRLQRLSGLARAPIRSLWALGSLAGTEDPTIPSLGLESQASSFTGIGAAANGGGQTAAAGKLGFVGAGASENAAGQAVAAGTLRFVGVGASAADGGLVAASGKLVFTGVGAGASDGGQASGMGTTAGVAPAAHVYEGGGWGYFNRKRLIEKPALEELQAAYEPLARTRLVGIDLVAVLSPFAPPVTTTAPSLAAIDWAALVAAAQTRELWAAIQAEIALREALRLAQEDEDEVMILLLAA